MIAVRTNITVAPETMACVAKGTEVVAVILERDIKANM